jgi:hypothetical protein
VRGLTADQVPIEPACRSCRTTRTAERLLADHGSGRLSLMPSCPRRLQPIMGSAIAERSVANTDQVRA